MYVSYAEQAMYENFTNYRTMKTLWTTIPPFLFLLGTFGNLMVLVVLYHHSRSISTYVYLIALAIADEIVLVNSLVKRWLEHGFGISVDCLSTYACRIFHFTSNASSHIAVWLIILVTIERVIVVSLPMSAHRYTRVSISRWAVVCLCFASFIINSHFFVSVKIVAINDTIHGNNWTRVVSIKYCDLDVRRLPNNFDKIWSWIDAMVYSYLPFGVILISNVIIISKLRHAQETRRHMTRGTHMTTPSPAKMGSRIALASSNSLQNTQNGKKKRMSTASQRGLQRTIMLLMVSFSFLLTVLPITIVKMIIANSAHLLAEPRYNATFLLASSVTELLMLTNHSLNFFLYCAAGQKFRADIYHLMCRGPLCRQQRNTRSQPGRDECSIVQSNVHRRHPSESHSLVIPERGGERVAGVPINDIAKDVRSQANSD